MDENWKPVKNYEGYYEVSNKGNVRSLDRVIIYPDGHRQLHKGVLLSKQITTWGYEQVKLTRNKKITRKHVHDLVADAFIPNNDNLLEVNHKNHIKTDNCVDNLEWTTHEDNMKDLSRYLNSKKTSKICPKCGGIKNHNSKYCKKCFKLAKAKLTTEQLELCLKEGMSFADIEKKYNVSSKTIRIKCKKAGICFHQNIPSKQEVIETLMKNSIKETSKVFSVSTNTLRSWIQKYNIQISEEIICIDQNLAFSSREDAFAHFKPECSFNCFRDNIKRSAKNNSTYLGYRWKINKIVF